MSATLGKQALNQGLVAGIVGFIIVALFLLDLLPRPRRDRVGALVVYAVYFFALVKLIPITLTLPGIAGLILTIGVAADANIVIFERVKEEIRAGKSIAAGIATGYRRGIAAIVDANFVTFITAFILFVAGHGRRQGLRAHARHRHPGLAVHRRAGDAGDARHAGPVAAAALAPGARRRRAEAHSGRSTSWARRSGSSRCPA